MQRGDRFRPRARALVGASVATMLAACTGGPEFPQTTFHPVTDYGEALNRVFANTFWWTMAILALVCVLVLVAVVRFRERPGTPHPKQIHGNTKLELLWTIVPSCPTAQARSPTVATAVRFARVGTSATWRQSRRDSDTSTWPRSPTAIARDPATAKSMISACVVESGIASLRTGAAAAGGSGGAPVAGGATSCASTGNDSDKAVARMARRNLRIGFMQLPHIGSIMPHRAVRTA